MRRVLTITIGLVAAVAIAVGAAALQQAPPQQQPQGTVRLPSIQFPPPQGPQPTLPGQGGRRQLPPFMGLERDRGEPANLEVGQVAVRRAVHVRPAPLHAGRRRERTRQRPVRAARRRPRPGTAVVARLPSGRA